METKNEITNYFETISLFLLGVLFFIFPLSFTNLTTDWFILPKQIVLSAVVLVTLVIFGARMISTGAVRLRRTPFDLAVFLFGIATLLSTIFAVNRIDSIITFVPLLFAIISYYLIVNFIKSKTSVTYLLISLIAGASLVSIITLLSTFKIYIFPFEYTRNQAFSPFGVIIDQVVFLAAVFAISISATIPFIKELIKSKKLNKADNKHIPFVVGSVIVLAGLIVSVYQFVVLQKPALLPLETGFQTAFAAISQDTGRITQGFLFGSGFGTYANDFTRFKQPTFNLNETLWSLTFFRSSNFVLEVLATAGFLGISTFMFLIYKILREVKLALSKNNEHKNISTLAIIILIVAAFVLPFSFISYALLFMILGLFAAIQGVNSKHSVYDIELHFVAFKKGIIPLSTSPVKDKEKSFTLILPVFSFIFFLVFSIIVGIIGVIYIMSDTLFQSSLVAASTNNGLQTYNKQTNAIQMFPYRDAYYRIYSQTNLALANSIASNIQKNSSPSAQVQQTVYTLINQSLNSAKLATSLSPQTALNWQNLSSIYRSLIGFGQNAEAFAIVSQQQAVLLDPNNPQQYLNLGGIYYQLKQYDNAQRQFQIAANLKPDFANAHYNLGHALESKGDLQNAYTQYLIVRNLMSNDKANLDKINKEIQTIEANAKAAQEAAKSKANQEKTSRLADNDKDETDSRKSRPSAVKEDLSISTPSAQLPAQKTPVKLPPPTTATDSAE